MAKRAKFSATIQFEIEYDETDFENAEEAGYYFLQEADYEFKYPDPTKIQVVKTEIYDSSDVKEVTKAD